MIDHKQFTKLQEHAQRGVDALSAATPVDTGETREKWYYEIVNRPGYFAIRWHNRHVTKPGHSPVAILIQHGHATRGGGYVQGRDFINPAMRPIFDQIIADMWKEVTR